MKHTLIIILLVCGIISSVTLNAKGRFHPPKKLNINPNITSENVWSYVADTNIYQDALYLNQGISFSAGSGWDFGIASYNTPLYGGGDRNYENDTYISISKTFIITPIDLVVIGSQAGTTLGNNQHTLRMLHFGTIRHIFTKNITTYIGPYYANSNLTATVNQVGFTTGIVLQIIPNKLEFHGDYISGHQNVSGAVSTLQLSITPKFAVYAGVIVPEMNSGNEFAGVVGVNLSTN